MEGRCSNLVDRLRPRPGLRRTAPSQLPGQCTALRCKLVQLCHQLLHFRDFVPWTARRWVLLLVPCFLLFSFVFVPVFSWCFSCFFCPKPPSPGPPSVGPPSGRKALRRTAHNFALFCHLPPQISLFSFTLWGLLVDLRPGFEAVDHPNCAFGLPGVIV